MLILTSFPSNNRLSLSLQQRTLDRLFDRMFTHRRQLYTALYGLYASLLVDRTWWSNRAVLVSVYITCLAPHPGVAFWWGILIALLRGKQHKWCTQEPFTNLILVQGIVGKFKGHHVCFPSHLYTCGVSMNKIPFNQFCDWWIIIFFVPGPSETIEP